MRRFLLFASMGGLLAGCSGDGKKEGNGGEGSSKFPKELVSFEPYADNPVFTAGDSNAWDSAIRERGFILKEGNEWYLWYNGYKKSDEDNIKYLGLATSSDGLNWKRYSDRPIYDSLWVEDMFVWKEDSTYYMVAEGTDDVAHLLTSKNRVDWKSLGSLDVRKTNGDPIDKGPYGTPVVWKENGTYYLFYERYDLGIWLATSTDMKVWTNVQEDPVIAMGPEEYDQFAVAVNQIIKYKGLYYAYYHASAVEDWREWTMNIAVSKDLVNWEKYEGNPILGNNLSSGMVVDTEEGFRLYTMHPEVHVFLPVKK